MILNYFKKFEKIFAFVLFYSLSIQLMIPHFMYGNIKTATFYNTTINESDNNRFLYNPSKETVNNISKTNNSDTINWKKNKNISNNIEIKQLDELDIDGPGQPEMSGFKPASVDNMVNLFSGDFNYNIPLLDVDGYPINMYYSAGITMEQEASWVGLGWNINPGTISRTMRGLPDDFDGGADKITKEQNIRKDINISIPIVKGKEILGFPLKFGNIGLSGGLGVTYHNKTGLGLEMNLGGEFTAQKDILRTVQDEKTNQDTVTIGANLNLTVAISTKTGSQYSGGIGFSTNYKYNKNTKKPTNPSTDPQSEQAKTNSIMGNQMMQSFINKGLGSFDFSNAAPSFTPTFRMPFETRSFEFGIKVGKVNKIKFDNWNFSGSYTSQYLAKQDKIQSRPAYGMLYIENGVNNENGLLDVNRLNDGVVNKRTEIISMPHYTHDYFNISGEGTGGTFRAFRSTPGYNRDVKMKSRSLSGRLNVDIGAGETGDIQVGAILGGTRAISQTGMWDKNNLLKDKIAFKSSNRTEQGVYFKNPMEMTVIDQGYYNAMGQDNLIRPILEGNSLAPRLSSKYQMLNENQTVKTLLNDYPNFTKINRDKRTQVISYLTNAEATSIGFNKQYYSYKMNTFLPPNCVKDENYFLAFDRARGDYRKPHHIGEINVLEGDGRRFVYGIPAYNIEQQDVQFSVENRNSLLPTDLTKIKYSNQDASIENDNGTEHFFQKETIPAFAHSFLLTQILSPDYVDITNNGITDDDLGTAINFNYTRTNKTEILATGEARVTYTNWRSPMSTETNVANYMNNLRSSDKDDKAAYSYGRKESWYLHSLVSKNMVATFTLGNRFDNKGAKSDKGEVDENDNSKKKLEKIDLYTKADFIKFGAKAKPIKTVHFAYSYKLCLNNVTTVASNNETGKLTLDSIWFSYNGNKKQSVNKYRFQYAAGDNNPSYNSTNIDKWGGYKNETNNPGNNSNQDYPYTIQNKNTVDNAAKAWNLEKILLPSGSKIEVDYESDTYAYVQNRKACVMNKIVGFGKNETSIPKLLSYNSSLFGDDYMYAFIDVERPSGIPTNVQMTAQIINKYYLQDFKQLLFKLFFETKNGVFEPITIYADFDPQKCGEVAGNPNRIYIKLEKTNRGKSPIFETIIRFLKDNVPDALYYAADVSDENAPMQVIKSLWGAVQGIVQTATGLENAKRSANKFNELKNDKCYIRLNQPNGMKYGGGYRVKKITIRDSWNKMTGSYDATYGQLYTYETVNPITNQKISSGVATYEPGIGTEENPYREVSKHYTKNGLNPYILGTQEYPIAETFFPSPSVGYSRVTVRSIRNNKEGTTSALAKIKSGIGYQETQFYTAKDFPITIKASSFDDESNKNFKTPTVFAKLSQIDIKTNTRTQGFLVKTNDMHGKQKYQASYAETDETTPINSTQYYYKCKKNGDGTYSLLNEVDAVLGSDGKIGKKIIGKDIEVSNDFAFNVSNTKTVGFIPLNFGLISGTIPWINIFKHMSYNESRYRHATTLKQVQEFGIIDSVVNNDKGSIVATENLLYDGETGQVLVSKTKNEFKRPIYQVNYPSHWLKNEMGAAYHNIDAEFKNISFYQGKITVGLTPTEQEEYFNSGDELYIKYSTENVVANSEACSSVQLSNSLPPATKIVWALDLSKTGQQTQKEFIFIDIKGNPISLNNVNIRIVRSGNRNILGASAGNAVCLVEPISPPDDLGNRFLMVNNSVKVINASAVEFKEKWRGENSFITKVDSITVKRYAQIKSMGIFPKFVNPENGVTNYTLKYYQTYKLLGGWKDEETVLSSVKNAPSVNFKHFHQEKRTRTQVRSWLLFDISNFPVDAVVTSARLHYYPHGSRYFNDNSNHQYDAASDISHQQGSPFNGGVNTSGGNTGIVDRPLMTWSNLLNPNNTKTTFDKDGILHTDQIIVPSTGLGYSNNFNGNFNNSIEVKSLFNNLIRDARNSALNYAPAISFKYFRGITQNMTKKGEDLYQCFNRNINFSVGYYRVSDLTTTPVLNPKFQYILVDSIIEKVVKCYNILDSSIYNPYVRGMLGNWRGWRSYVFNGQRLEKDPNTKTKIINDGVIENFQHFWNLGANSITQSGNTKWQWNSEITQYNRKGIEVENRDPLGRYNAGLYGYQQSLPIAVANNAKYKEIAFDGFEDYYYNSDPCLPFCDPNIKHFETGINKANLDANIAHTGRYSVPVAANQKVDIKLPITVHNNVYSPTFTVNKTVTQSPNPLVTLRGNGLTGRYYYNTYWSGSYIERLDKDVNLFFDTKGNGNCKPNHPMPYSQCKNISVEWNGWIQIDKSGVYNFLGLIGDNVNDYAEIHINGIIYTKSIHPSVSSSHPNQSNFNNNVTLNAGMHYPIKILYYHKKGYGKINLHWSFNNGSYVPVPTKHLYNNLALINGTVVTQYCTQYNQIRSNGQVVIDRFGLTASTTNKYVASIWVKVDPNRSVFKTYENEVDIKIKNGSTDIVKLMPKEGIIEGWQMFEAVFAAPANVSNLTWEIKNLTGTQLNFDDIRIHPYASNMKSFVYDPVSLRLTSELDENNFASFYEYDEDGTLIRVKKETREGIKTITETRSSLQKVVTNFQ